MTSAQLGERDTSNLGFSTTALFTAADQWDSSDPVKQIPAELQCRALMPREVGFLDTFGLSSWAYQGMDDHLLGAVGGGSRGVGLSGSTNQRHGWCLVRGSDRGQVSLITPRDEVIRQFRFHDPPKNLPLYKRGEAGLR